MNIGIVGPGNLGTGVATHTEPARSVRPASRFRSNALGFTYDRAPLR
jgi:hypothetical protein